MLRLVLMFLLCGTAFAETSKFGKELTGKATKIKLADIASHADNKKTLLVEGKVEKLCKKKGCWMNINDGSASVTVRFEGYSFFVPMKLEGKKIRAEGIVKKVTQSVADQKHYAKDAGASAAEIAKIKEPKETHEFIATGVKQI